MGVSSHFLGLDCTISPIFGVFKEHPCSAHWARSDQRHLYPGPIDPVVMDRQRRRQKIQHCKKTKVTTTNQNGSRFRTERPAPPRAHCHRRLEELRSSRVNAEFAKSDIRLDSQSTITVLCEFPATSILSCEPYGFFCPAAAF